MTVNYFINLVTSTYTSLGSAALILVALSAWLGKLWAKRILQDEINKHSVKIENLRNELDNINKKDITRHNDKLSTYRSAIDLFCEILTEIEDVGTGSKTTISEKAKNNFSINRNKIYGNISLVSNQEVMDKYNALIDYFISSIYHGKDFSWKEMRDKVDVLLNEMRKDLGVNNGDVVYKGSL